MDDMIEALHDAAGTLEAMRQDGVFLEDDGAIGDDYAHLVTTDPEVAKKYDMVEESEYWRSGEEEEGTRDVGEDGEQDGEAEKNQDKTPE